MVSTNVAGPLLTRLTRPVPLPAALAHHALEGAIGRVVDRQRAVGVQAGIVPEAFDGGPGIAVDAGQRLRMAVQFEVGIGDRRRRTS